MRLTIAGAQVPVLGDIDINVDTACMAIDEAVAAGADILLTPEGSVSGYTHEFDPIAVERGVNVIAARAARAGLGLALGTCYKEPADGKVYNQLRFYDRDGAFLGFHAKILRTFTEAPHFATAPLRCVSIVGIVAGGLICNDAWANPDCTNGDDPVLVRKLASMGARAIFHAVNGGRSNDPFSDVFRAFHESNLRIRAKAARCWIVTADNCFPFNVPCSCPSGIIDPDGNWVVKAPPVNDHVFCATIDVAP